MKISSRVAHREGDRFVVTKLVASLGRLAALAGTALTVGVPPAGNALGVMHAGTAATRTRPSLRRVIMVTSRETIGSG